MMPPFHILWLKRDLRWQDHDPLWAAIKAEKPLLALYCFEPLISDHPDSSSRHRKMQIQALQGLRGELGAMRNHLLIIEANADEVIDFIASHFPLAEVYSHREHGVLSTYERDKRLTKICRKHQVSWHEFNHNGVLRGKDDRSGWDEEWRAYMQRPLRKANIAEWPSFNGDDLKEISEAIGEQFRLSPIPKDSIKRSLNRKNSLSRLRDFLAQEAQGYQGNMGDPLASQKHCSRLSVALAWGTLSLREVYQMSIEAHQNANYRSDLRAFISRLHWHSHFIQKFEMEMRMEFENINKGYNKIRQESNPAYYDAWVNGMTGVPIVDACMRAVKATGYLNFRMRAMVVSFWSHILWQPWQVAVHHLARCFSDFIPGIHYPQFQMQSSVTGINIIRVYNPVKQSLEKDPNAAFIIKWVPELASLPLAFQHEPWNLSALESQFYNFKLGKDYPHPLVDVHKAANFARGQLWEMKQDPEVLVENKRILKRHTVANRDINSRTKTIMKRNGGA